MKKLLVIAIMALVCIGFTGCDRTAPEVSGVTDVIEIDCGTKLNIENYLNENLKITDETDDGTVEYNLADLEHAITCDESVYDSETGELDTNKYGEYDISLSVQDESNNKSNLDFKVKINPLKMETTFDDIVEMDCGAEFNVLSYLKENISITNQAGDVEYKLEDFDYTIDCDESAYNADTGDFDTSKFGEFPIKVTLNSESFENNSVSFTVKLNPLVIDKGYYIYESEVASSGYEYLGFCEYKNTSSENLKVKSIEFRYYDKDDIMVGSSDMPDYSLEYVRSGSSGYALDTFASFNSMISSDDEIVRVDVLIDFGKASGDDTTSLEVGDMEITNSYDYNVSGFAGTAVVTNPYDKDVEYYSLLAGMYDEDGHIIGVMSDMGSDGMAAEAKARGTAAWLPDSREIPDQVSSVKGSARVTSFE